MLIRAQTVSNGTDTIRRAVPFFVVSAYAWQELILKYRPPFPSAGS